MSQGPGQRLGNLDTCGCTSTDLYRQEVPSPGCGLLLCNGHLVGTGEVSRQSVSQSPVLGRHSNKQRGAWGMGREEPERGRQVHMQWPRHPALWDPVCFTDHGLSPCSSALFLSQRQDPHTPHTHTYTQTPHTLPLHTHTHTHTHTNSSLTPHTHTPSHTPHTPLHMPHNHTHIHTPHTHNLTHSSLTRSHTHTHSSPSHTHTQIQTQSLQEHTHRKHGDPEAVLKHQACGECGNSPESQLRSVAGASTHWEPLGPRSSLREWRGLRLTQLGPEQTSLLCKICHN